MRSHTEYLTMNVPQRRGFVNITREVAAAVEKSGVREGLVLVNAMHISASVRSPRGWCGPGISSACGR